MVAMIGTLAYCVNSGLGLLAKSFYDNGVVSHVLEIRHPTYERQEGWYPADRWYPSWDSAGVTYFLDSIKTLLIFENAFGQWSVVQRARSLGIRIVLMPMYEYTPNPTPIEPDLYICPSELDLACYIRKPSIFLPVPAPTYDKVPWRLRTEARTFVHNAGHGGKNYRNGTPELLDAIPLVRSEARFIIRGQSESRQIQALTRHPSLRDSRVEFAFDNVSEGSHCYLWERGEVFVFPEKFNGLSLPLQEAHAAGMLVMCGNRFPMNLWLPAQPMIPVSYYDSYHIARNIQVAQYNPHDIAATIDAWYEKDISTYSLRGKEWREENSWDKLRDTYLSHLLP